MVRLKYFPVLILLLTSTTSSESDDEELAESKKLPLKVKTKLSGMNDFHCNLHLMPQQQKMMYSEYSNNVQKREVSFDLYKWPKNKDGLVIVPYYVSRTSLYCE